MQQEMQRHGIANMVARKRAAVARLEGVVVNPLAVRSTKLLVHEAIWRLPEIDAGAPAQRQSVDAQPIINQRAGFHLDGGV